MNPFAIYLLKRMPLPEVLKEHSELLDPEAINRLFRQQALEMLQRVQDPADRKDLVGFLRMNVVAYIDKAFRRAGIRDPDLDEAIQTIVVKFLVTPGNLFRGWKPDQLFTPRFKTAVKNSVITLGQRNKKQAKRFQELPQEPPARKAVAVEDDPIQDFRHFVELRYGPAVLRALDHRLADKTNTKDVVGQSGLKAPML